MNLEPLWSSRKKAASSRLLLRMDNLPPPPRSAKPGFAAVADIRLCGGEKNVPNTVVPGSNM